MGRVAAATAGRPWPVFAAVTVTGLAALALPSGRPLIAALALGPLASAGRLPPRTTLATGGYAVAWALGIGLATGTLTQSTTLVAIVVVMATAAISVAVCSQWSDLADRARSLEELAATDPLTGLASRRSVLSYAHALSSRRDTTRTPIGIVLVDADHFKHINDSLGHQAGDQVLAQLGHRVLDCLRGADRAGRYGGEELILVLADTDLDGTRRLAERVCATIRERPVHTSRGDVRVTVSAGIAAGTRPAQDLIAEADRGLYAAKAAGRDQVCAAPSRVDLTENAIRRLRLPRQAPPVSSPDAPH
jgi:diguanylate cyclase (GGDEF)-like protein